MGDLPGTETLPDGSGGPHASVAGPAVPILAADGRHHLDRVLRLRDGDPLTVDDGAGRWCPALFRAGGEPEMAGDVVIVPAPERTVAVGFAFIRVGLSSWWSRS